MAKKSEKATMLKVKVENAANEVPKAIKAAIWDLENEIYARAERKKQYPGDTLNLELLEAAKEKLKKLQK